jgi:ketosteroid isomerase-like protein
MMMRKDNEALKERFVAAVMSGDKNGIKAALADDFILHQSKGQPYAGVYRGAEGFLSAFDKLKSTYAIEALSEVGAYWSADPDHAIFEFEMGGRISATGQPFKASILEHWAFKSGKLASIMPYWFEIPG